MQLVPPGMVTMESAARHLHISTRRLNALAAQTPLHDIATVALGRSLGTYRLVPQLGVVLLRQALARSPHHLCAWQDALLDVLSSQAWQGATTYLSGRNRMEWYGGSGHAVLEAMLVSMASQSVMDALHQTSLSAIDRHGLGDLIQIEGMVVDRMEDDDDAVILVGATQRAYLLPRELLRVAGLEREKAWGVLVATHTSEGISLDVWPAVGTSASTAWQPDHELLAQRVEVGA